MRYKVNFVILATLLLVVALTIPVLGTEGISLEQARDEIVSYYVYNKSTLDSWEEVVGLARAGEDLSDGTWQLPDWGVDSLDESSSSAAYATTILGMLAAGQNPRDVSGRNLVDELAARQTGNGDFGAGIHNTTWSMVALDSAGGNYSVSGAVYYLLDQQTSDGGFAFSGDIADPDMTGFTLIALAPHSEIAGVSEAIAEAKQCLKNLQLESGGFSSGGIENAESIASVIRGLVACGEDITADEWKKNGQTMIDALFALQLEDKSFSHTMGGNSNAMATRQALIAVADMVKAGVTYTLGQDGQSGSGQEEGKTVRVRVEGATGSLADEVVTVTGTALDALKAAVGEGNVTAPGGFITDILGESGQNGVAENTDTGWCYYVINDGEIEPTAFNEGAGSYNVENGDEVVFYIGAYDTQTWASKTYLPVVSVSPASPTAGQTVIINIAAQKYVWGVGLQELSPEETT